MLSLRVEWRLSSPGTLRAFLPWVFAITPRDPATMGEVALVIPRAGTVAAADLRACVVTGIVLFERSGWDAACRWAQAGRDRGLIWLGSKGVLLVVVVPQEPTLVEWVAVTQLSQCFSSTMYHWPALNMTSCFTKLLATTQLLAGTVSRMTYSYGP